jgi:ketosteroid isomerase-like protein
MISMNAAVLAGIVTVSLAVPAADAKEPVPADELADVVVDEEVATEEADAAAEAPAEDARPVPANASVKDQIIARNQQYMKAWSARSAARVAALYAPTGRVYPKAMAPVSGRSNLKAWIQGALDAGMHRIVLRTNTVDVPGPSLAVEFGYYQMRLANGTVAESGTYLVVWRKLSGKWFVDKDFIRPS